MPTATDLIPIEIPLGKGGLNSGPNLDDIPATDLTESEGTSYEDNTIKKEGGATKINTTVITGAPSVIGLADFFDSTFTQYLVGVTADGKIITINTGGIAATLKTGLTVNSPAVFAEGATALVKKLFAFNGVDPVQVWDGVAVSTSDLATPPADWATTRPAGGVQHNNALWAWAGHRLYKSTNADHEDFTIGATASDGQLLNIFPGEGMKIVAGVSFLGRLFLFKYPRGIYWVDDTDPDPINWVVKRMTLNVGAAGPDNVAVGESDVMFWGTDGLPHILSGVTEFGDARSSAIKPNELIHYLRDHTTVNRYYRAIVRYYPTKREYHIALTEGSGGVNNRRFVIDVQTPGNPMVRTSSRDVVEAMTIRIDSAGVERLILGDDAGFVWQLDSTTYEKGGLGYTSRFKTPALAPFPRGRQRTNLHELEIVMKQLSTDLTLNLSVELDEGYTYNLNPVVIVGQGARLGSFELDVDTLGSLPSKTLHFRRRLYGDCRRVRIIGSNNTAGEAYSVAALILWVTPGNRR